MKNYNLIDKNGNILLNFKDKKVVDITWVSKNIPYLVYVLIFDEKEENNRELYIVDIRKGEKLFDSPICSGFSKHKYDNGKYYYINITTIDGENNVLYIGPDGYKVCAEKCDYIIHFCYNEEIMTIIKGYNGNSGICNEVKYIKLKKGNILKQTEEFDLGELLQKKNTPVLVAKSKNGKYQYNFLDENFETISKKNEWFTEAFPFKNGIAEVKNEEGKWNILKLDGELISPDKWFDSIQCTYNKRYYIAYIKSVRYILSVDGDCIEVNFDNAQKLLDLNISKYTIFDDAIYDNEYTKVELYKKYNWIHNNDKKLLFPNRWFDHVTQFNKDGVSIVTENINGKKFTFFANKNGHICDTREEAIEKL